MADPIQLHYAPRPRALRRYWRGALTLLLMLLAGAVGYRYHRPVWEQLNQWYWQRQCMRHLSPPNAIAHNQTGGGLLYTPAPARHVRLAGPTSPAPSTAGIINGSPFSPNWPLMGSSNVFLHARRAPGKPQRLVSVSPSIMFAIVKDMAVVPEEYLHVGFTVEIIQPASLGRPGRRLTNKYVPVENGPDWNVQLLYAGHPDPADESHFTIEFEANGQRGVIDGWLRADDTVELRARSPVAQGGH